jgi:hypothetical protein
MSISLSGSLVISGSLTTTGTISMSGSIASASYALNATTGAYANTSTSASYALNADLLDGLNSTVFATTGSNTFTGTQYISNTNNAIGFSNTTSSIYTDGGLQVTKDAYLSSSLYIKGNLTVYGTQSVSYITSSTLNITTNLITVNTATPSVRFGGIAVQDSGSTAGLTGSLLWDSQNNSWLYDNPSGSGNYDSAMVIMGPRNSSALGNEAGLSCNYLVQGHGHHHTTSSAIFHDGSTTCIGTGMSITSAGITCFAGRICSPSLTTDVVATIGSTFTCPTAAGLGYGIFGYSGVGLGIAASATGPNQGIAFFVCGDYERMRIVTSGNVGIGTSCPFAIADVNLSVNGSTSSAMQLGVANTRTGQLYASSGEVRLSAVTSIPLNLYTNDLKRMSIAATGEACFACQVCSGAGFLAPDYYNYSAYPYNTNFGAGADATTTTLRAGSTAGQQTCITLTGQNGASPTKSILMYTSSALRLQIDGNGVACFANTVCTSTLKANAVDIIAGSCASFTFGVDQQSTFAFGSTNGKRVAIIRDSTCGDNGLQFGYDTTDKTGIIAGSATSVGAGIDFYTYNGSAWANRMRLNKDGNVGIGTTSPQGILSIKGTTNNTVLEFDNGGTTNAFLRSYDRTASAYRELTFYANFIDFNTGSSPSNAMRITSGGTLAINTSSPYSGAKLQVKTATNINLAIQTGTADTTGIKINAFNDAADTNIPLELNGSIMILKTGETEKMRISGGNCVAMSDVDFTWGYSGRGLHLSKAGTGPKKSLFADGSAYLYFGGSDTNSWARIYAMPGSAGMYMNNGDSSWTSNSDIRIKTCITKIENSLDKVMCFSGYEYQLKDDCTGKMRLGVIAQELENILPQVISCGYSPEHNEDILGVSYTDLIPVLVNAIQELKHQNDTFKTCLGIN